MKKYQHYINGEWIDSTGNELIAVVNPATEEVIGEISAANKENMGLLFRAAKTAKWEDKPSELRSRRGTPMPAFSWKKKKKHKNKQYHMH